MNFVRIIIRRLISFAVLSSTLRGNHRLHPPVWRLASGQGRGEARVSHQPRGFRVGKNTRAFHPPTNPQRANGS